MSKMKDEEYITTEEIKEQLRKRHPVEILGALAEKCYGDAISLTPNTYYKQGLPVGLCLCRKCKMAKLNSCLLVSILALQTPIFFNEEDGEEIERRMEALECIVDAAISITEKYMDDADKTVINEYHRKQKNNDSLKKGEKKCRKFPLNCGSFSVWR